jgi:hypothetical protein
MSEMVKEQSNKIVEPYTHKAWRMLRKSGYALSSLVLASTIGTSTTNLINAVPANANSLQSPDKAIVWNANLAAFGGGGGEPVNPEFDDLNKLIALHEQSTLVSLQWLYSDSSRIYAQLNKDGLLYDPRIEGSSIKFNDKGLFEASFDFSENAQWNNILFQETGRAILTNNESGETTEFFFSVQTDRTDGSKIDDFLPVTEGMDEKFLRQLLDAYKNGNVERHTANPILDGEFILFLNELNSPDSIWEWEINQNGSVKFKLTDNMARYGEYAVTIGEDKELKSEQVKGAFVYAQDSIFVRKDSQKEYSSEWRGNRPT